jgi:hypothetical protein
MLDLPSKKVWSIAFGGIPDGEQRARGDVHSGSTTIFIHNPAGVHATAVLSMYGKKELLKITSVRIKPYETLSLRCSDFIENAGYAASEWTGVLVSNEPVILRQSYRGAAQYEHGRHSLFAYADHHLIDE